MEAITLKRAPRREGNSEEERLLVQQAQNGDREAFEQLVYRHDRDILRLAFHMLGNREEAQDVFQDTFLKAYRSLARFRSDSSSDSRPDSAPIPTPIPVPIPLRFQLRFRTRFRSDSAPKSDRKLTGIRPESARNLPGIRPDPPR